MKDKEIADECRKDYLNIAYKIASIEKKYWRVIVKKPNASFVFKPIEYTSLRKNKYIIMLNSAGKKDLRLHGVLYNAFLIYRKKESIYVVLSKLGTPCSILTSHLFDRYRERFFKDMTIPKMEVIKSYIYNNYMFYSDIGPDNVVYGTVNDGINLGESYPKDNYVVYKTFVSRELLFSDQLISSEFHNEKLYEALKNRKQQDLVNENVIRSPLK